MKKGQIFKSKRDLPSPAGFEWNNPDIFETNCAMIPKSAETAKRLAT